MAISPWILSSSSSIFANCTRKLSASRPSRPLACVRALLISTLARSSSACIFAKSAVAVSYSLRASSNSALTEPPTTRSSSTFDTAGADARIRPELVPVSALGSHFPRAPEVDPPALPTASELKSLGLVGSKVMPRCPSPCAGAATAPSSTDCLATSLAWMLVTFVACNAPSSTTPSPLDMVLDPAMTPGSLSDVERVVPAGWLEGALCTSISSAGLVTLFDAPSAPSPMGFFPSTPMQLLIVLFSGNVSSSTSYESESVSLAIRTGGPPLVPTSNTDAPAGAGVSGGLGLLLSRGLPADWSELGIASDCMPESSSLLLAATPAEVTPGGLHVASSRVSSGTPVDCSKSSETSGGCGAADRLPSGGTPIDRSKSSEASMVRGSASSLLAFGGTPIDCSKSSDKSALGGSLAGSFASEGTPMDCSKSRDASCGGSCPCLIASAVIAIDCSKSSDSSGRLCSDRALEVRSRASATPGLSGLISSELVTAGSGAACASGASTATDSFARSSCAVTSMGLVLVNTGCRTLAFTRTVPSVRLTAF
mmetsp:Transcript_23137/g.70883  ORF Transcript_23137/g.70883 Transcript_23137/m.70883 type:complete len:540 (+) Transcript_23137:545-2164(+)